jgi:surfactin synthase thioesterase subunit
VPVVIISGVDDPCVRDEHLDGWTDITTGEAHKRLLEGGHAFVHSCEQALLRLLSRHLTRTGSRSAVAVRQQEL